MSIRIITDSASDMSPAEHPALRVLPLSVTFGTDVYMDGVDIDHQRFYEMLVERDELPKTGQVNPYAFSQTIAEAREAGDEAVIITVGAKLSGTNQSARTALAEAPGGDVFVVDSNNVTLGERVLVEYALRLVDEGRSAARSRRPSRQSVTAWWLSVCLRRWSTWCAAVACLLRPALWARCST